MSRHRPKEAPETYVQLMYKYAAELKSFVDSGELTPERLGMSLFVQRATVKSIELVGEEAWLLRKLDYSLEPSIDLDDIAGMRHRMVHSYEGIDWGIVEQVVFNDIPLLVENLEREMLARGIEIPDVE